jgi:hypothetical protein
VNVGCIYVGCVGDCGVIVGALVGRVGDVVGDHDCLK